MNHEIFQRSLKEAEAVIRGQFANWTLPEIFLQFGNGFDLSAFFDEPPQTIPLRSLPLMPEHETPDNVHPELIFGYVDGIPVLATCGHRHLFEGLGPIPCIFPAALAWHLGIKKHVFIEPAIGLHPEYKIGSWTLLTDFINGHAISPLDGLLSLLETPFTDMTHALSQRLNSELVNAFSQVDINPRLCIYQSRPGAHFCTPAEAKAALANHADVIGHDLVMEIITAHALKCEVAAFALIAGLPPREGGKPLHRQDILDTCAFCSPQFLRGLRIAIQELHQIDSGNRNDYKLPEQTADETLFQDFKRPSGKPPVLKQFLR